MNYSLPVINYCPVSDDNMVALHSMQDNHSVDALYETTNQQVNLFRRDDDGQVLESKHELIHKWPSVSFDLKCSQFTVIPNHFLTCALFGPKTYSFNFTFGPSCL